MCDSTEFWAILCGRVSDQAVLRCDEGWQVGVCTLVLSRRCRQSSTRPILSFPGIPANPDIAQRAAGRWRNGV